MRSDSSAAAIASGSRPRWRAAISSVSQILGQVLVQVAVRTPMLLQGRSRESVCGVGVAACQSQLRLLPQVRCDKWAVGAVKPLVNSERLIGQRRRARPAIPSSP